MNVWRYTTSWCAT